MKTKKMKTKELANIVIDTQLSTILELKKCYDRKELFVELKEIVKDILKNLCSASEYKEYHAQFIGYAAHYVWAFCIQYEEQNEDIKEPETVVDCEDDKEECFHGVVYCEGVAVDNIYFRSTNDDIECYFDRLINKYEKATRIEIFDFYDKYKYTVYRQHRIYDKDSKDLYEYIRYYIGICIDYRLTHGISRYQVAKETGLRQETIKKLEEKLNPYCDVLSDYIDYFSYKCNVKFCYYSD